MAIMKCKMCGGDLDIVVGETICECLYCGSKQTLPALDNEKKTNLFARANKLRFGCEFDKAAGIYESIIVDWPEEAEAYWGLVLCKYGIEYVDDPQSGKKIPTCHRSGFDSVMDDDNLEQALENADAVARKIYRDEAKAIEEIRKGIIAVSASEEPYDIFICYKETDENGERTLDSVLAQDIYDTLTAKGYRVFFARITLEDKLGQEYEPYIFAALNSAKIMLAIGTDYEYYNAVWVKNEWSRFLQLMATDPQKHLIPCFKNIDAYDIPKEFARLQAQDLGKVGAVQDLLRGVEKLLPKADPQTATMPAVTVQQAAGPDVSSLLERTYMFLEDGEWEDADSYCERVLDIDPKCAQAYIYKLLAKFQNSCLEDLLDNDVVSDPLFQKALRFAKGDFLAKLESIRNESERRKEEARLEEERRKEEARLEEERRKEEARLEEERRKEEARLEEERRKEEARLRAQAAIKQCQKARARYVPANALIAVSSHHTVGLHVNGTVTATGENDDGQCNTHNWVGIVAVAAGNFHTVGLKVDGTVVTTGLNNNGQCNTHNWVGIVAVAAGNFHTVGLKANGTVVATGDNTFGQCNVEQWTEIVAIATGSSHTVGLKADGTVVATGKSTDGQCNVEQWTEIVAIATGSSHTIGLKADGTLVATGSHIFGECKVEHWTEIAVIAAGGLRTFGLKADGTLVATGSNGDGKCLVERWTEIVAIAASFDHTVGLKADGTLVATGSNGDGKCLVEKWKLFGSIDTLAQEQESAKPAMRQAIKQAPTSAARRAKGVCQHCGGAFKGLFTKKCTACGKEKDY